MLQIHWQRKMESAELPWKLPQQSSTLWAATHSLRMLHLLCCFCHHKQRPSLQVGLQHMASGVTACRGVTKVQADLNVQRACCAQSFLYYQQSACGRQLDRNYLYNVSSHSFCCVWFPSIQPAVTAKLQAGPGQALAQLANLLLNVSCL